MVEMVGLVVLYVPALLAHVLLDHARAHLYTTGVFSAFRQSPTPLVYKDAAIGEKILFITQRDAIVRPFPCFDTIFNPFFLSPFKFLP